jgi:hypothetical protein
MNRVRQDKGVPQPSTMEFKPYNGPAKPEPQTAVPPVKIQPFSPSK